MMKKIDPKDEVFGVLQFADGSSLDLEGQTLEAARQQIAGRVIVDYGTDWLGNEAAVYLSHADIEVRGRGFIGTVAKLRELFAR